MARCYVLNVATSNCMLLNAAWQLLLCAELLYEGHVKPAGDDATSDTTLLCPTLC